MEKVSSKALKEWAVTVKALNEGKQIILICKGGIREEKREFQIDDKEFFLYPTYEHQKSEPQVVDVLPEYGGCRSWINLAIDIPLFGAKAVLTNEEFNRRVEEIRRILVS